MGEVNWQTVRQETYSSSNLEQGGVKVPVAVLCSTSLQSTIINGSFFNFTSDCQWINSNKIIQRKLACSFDT